MWGLTDLYADFTGNPRRNRSPFALKIGLSLQIWEYHLMLSRSWTENIRQQLEDKVCYFANYNKNQADYIFILGPNQFLGSKRKFFLSWNFLGNRRINLLSCIIFWQERLSIVILALKTELKDYKFYSKQYPNFLPYSTLPYFFFLFVTESMSLSVS